MTQPVQFEESEITPRDDGTFAIAFKARETVRDVAATTAVTVIGWPAGLAQLRDQIAAALLSPPKR